MSDPNTGGGAGTGPAGPAGPAPSGPAGPKPKLRDRVLIALALGLPTY
jgi:hypothetical protein